MHMLSLAVKRAHVVGLVILVACILYVSHSLDAFPGIKPFHEYLRFRHDLHVLNSTGQEEFDPLSMRPFPVGGSWLDLVGFRKNDGMAWGRLHTWWQRCRGVGEWRRIFWYHDSTHIPRYKVEDWDEPTGEWAGEWVRYQGGFNKAGYISVSQQIADFTGSQGKVTVNFEDMKKMEMEVFASHDVEYELGYVTEVHLERGQRLVREAAATLTIRDDNTDDGGVLVDVYGVHWPRIGVIFMTTTSAKFAGIFGLPHLSMSWDYYTSSQRLLSSTVGKTPAGKRALSNDEHHAPRPTSCQYVVYIQMHLADKKRMWLNVNETETLPKCTGDRGTTLGKTESPMSLAIFSPDCGFILETKGQRLDYSLVDYIHYECEEVIVD